MMFRIAVFVRLSRVFFLDTPGVRKNQLRQILGSGGAKNSTRITLSSKAWEIADVVQVRMREDDGIQRARWHRELVPVPESQFFQSLKKPAIKQNSSSMMLEEVFGAGYGTGSAQERQSGHGQRLTISGFCAAAHLRWYSVGYGS